MSTVSISPSIHREPERGSPLLQAVHTTGGREGPRLRRHCCKTSLAKPRALAAWCMESQAFRSAPRSSWKSFLS